MTLFDFEMNWSKWSGKFKIRFDEFECQDTFGLGMEITGLSPGSYYVQLYDQVTGFATTSGVFTISC